MAKNRDRSLHPWKENLEGLSLAIIMALTLKYFVIEAYKIPTGSMQPTLMGVDLPELQIFDRILVDKIAYLMREPKRWEVIVFKYPLDQSKNYIKRLIGLPGESIRIENGNLYLKSPEGDYQILRKPREIQESLWKNVFRCDPDDEKSPPPKDLWKTQSGSWEFVGRQWTVLGPGKLGFNRPIRDYYSDGYPKAIKEIIARSQRESGNNSVGDIRLSFSVLPTEKCDAIGASIDTGDKKIQVLLPGPLGNGEAKVLIDGKPFDFFPCRLESLRQHRICLSYVDETLELGLDGKSFYSHNLPDSPEPNRKIVRTPVEIEAIGGGANFIDVEVDRDVYYTQASGQRDWALPEGMYFFLGDNTQNSYDGRLWRENIYTLNPALAQNNPLELRGDAGSTEQNPKTLPPIDQGSSLLSFTDQFGEVHIFREKAIASTDQKDHPFVPREFIVGKAICVFWPVPPFSPVRRWKVIF